MKRATLERRVRTLEVALSGVTKLALGDVELLACSQRRRSAAKAIDDAVRTRAHGYVMTSNGQPVRILCADARSTRDRPLVGLVLYAMGHEIPEQFRHNGHCVAGRGGKDLVPFDRANLEDGFRRYGQSVLKEVGL